MATMNDTPDLPISLDTALEELLRATGQLLRRLRAEANPSELNWSQTWALARLDRHGPMNTADLARGEGVKPQSMGSTLADLEQDGLIKRRPHPTDGRQVLFELTDKGWPSGKETACSNGSGWPRPWPSSTRTSSRPWSRPSP